MNRRISQLLSVALSKKQEHGEEKNALLLLLPMGLGDAVMFLDSIDYYFENHAYDEIVIMTTALAHKVFSFARPNLKYHFIEYNPMKMDTDTKCYIHFQNLLGKTHYKTIVYPLRGFLSMDLLFSKLDADEKICIDTLKNHEEKGLKVRVRDHLIKGAKVIEFSPSDMDLIRYARVASNVCSKEIYAKLPQITIDKEKQQHPYIQISVGSSRPEKCWPAERYRDIVNYILSNTSYDLVFTGAKDDRKTVEGIIRGVEHTNRIRNLCGETSLEDLFRIINNARLLIGGDSGPIHVAAALDTPSLCIVGGWDYERVYPYKVDIQEKGRCAPVTVNTGFKDCYRCLLLHGQRGATNPRCQQMIKEGKPCLCIEDIPSELVITAIEKHVIE